MSRSSSRFTASPSGSKQSTKRPSGTEEDRGPRVRLGVKQGAVIFRKHTARVSVSGRHVRSQPPSLCHWREVPRRDRAAARTADAGWRTSALSLTPPPTRTTSVLAADEIAKSSSAVFPTPASPLPRAHRYAQPVPPHPADRGQRIRPADHAGSTPRKPADRQPLEAILKTSSATMCWLGCHLAP